VAGEPALALAGAFTVTETVFVPVHVDPLLLLVSVSVYVVFTDGHTCGLDEVEVKPVGLLTHE
jgi:hypothetical protein